MPASRLAKLILPEADYLRLDEIADDGQDLMIAPASCQTTVCCPSCGVTATREPGRYVPRPGDLPCVGRRVHLQLNVRRFFCDNPGCQQRTFVKRLPGVVSSFARRTARLVEAQRQIGLALGGEAVTGGRDMAFASRSCAAPGPSTHAGTYGLRSCSLRPNPSAKWALKTQKSACH